MDSRTFRSTTNGYTNQNIDCIDDICYDLYINTEDKHNDYIEDLPSVELNLFCSGSTSNSGSQKTRTNTKKKIDKAVEEGSIKNKKSDRENAKQKIAEEKAAKKQMQELNKIYKPGECMKYMQVEVHPAFLEKWYAGDIEREVSASGAKVITSIDIFDPGLVLWKRSVPQTLVSNDGQLDMTPRHEVSDRGLYVLMAEAAAQYICEHKLSQLIATVSNIVNVKLTIIIFGEQEYFKTASKKTKGKNQAMSEVDLEMAISDLLVSTGCDTVVVNQANELALLIVQFTKAIAEGPYKQLKRACDEQADFYMRGDNKNCVSVDKDGNGLSCLWQQMLAVLPQSSLETSRALCAQYKTPLDLHETLKQPEGVKTVAELGVSRSAVPGSRARRIGPEFARKLHTLLTAEDGNMLIE